MDRQKLSEEETRRLFKALTFGTRYGVSMTMKDALKPKPEVTANLRDGTGYLQLEIRALAAEEFNED